MTSLVVRSRSTARRCAACHDDLAPAHGSARWTCVGCGTALHRACLPGLRRCPTLGCRRPLAPSPSTSRRRARPGQGGHLLAALVVVAPALLAASYPALLWGGSVLVQGVCDALRLPSLAFVPLSWLAVLLAPFVLGAGVLAPLAHDRDVPGRHELRAGVGALAGFALGTAGSILLFLLLLAPRLC